MTMIRYNTNRTITLGPILDDDGVAVTNEVVGSIKISKNGGAPGALDGAAVLTHQHTGHYLLGLDSVDVSALGILELSIDNGVNAMPPVRLNVVPANVFDSLVLGSDYLQGDLMQWLGNTIATPATAGVPEVDLTHILGHLLTQTGTQLADGFEHFFDVATPTGTVDSLPAPVPGATGGLPVRGGAIPDADADAAGGLPISDAGGLDMDDLPTTSEFQARTLAATPLANLTAQYDGTRPVLYVSTAANGGDDANDGSGWGKAKLTLGSAVAAAGGEPYVIRIDSGTIDETASVVLTAGLRIIGSGIGQTELQWNIGSLDDCLILASNVTIEDLAIVEHADGESLYGLRDPASDVECENVILNRVLVNTNIDSILLNSGSTNVRQITCNQCSFEGGWDAILNADTACRLVLHDCRFDMARRNVFFIAATQTLECTALDCNFRATALSDGDCVKVQGAGSKLVLVDSALDGCEHDIYQTTDAEVYLVNCQYDPAKVFGTVIDLDERAVANILNDPVPDSPTEHSPYQRVKALDELTEASGDGDLADALGYVHRLVSGKRRHYPAGTDITDGDLCYMATADNKVYPASSQADEGSESGNQELFAKNFVGVAEDICTVATGVWCYQDKTLHTFSCPDDTYTVGQLVGVDENAGGDGLLDQTVAKVSNHRYAIGRVAVAVTGTSVEIVPFGREESVDWEDGRRLDLLLDDLPTTTEFEGWMGGAYKIASTTGDWATAGTWAGGVVPSAGDNIIIRNGVTVTIAADLDLGQFGTQELQGSGVLNIGSGQTVAWIPAGWTVDSNAGTVTANYGTVMDSDGTVTNNYGTVTANSGTMTINNGTVTANSGTIASNSSTGTVTSNGGTVTNNYGMVTANYGTVTTNFGTGTVMLNYNTVTNNLGKVNLIQTEVDASQTGLDWADGGRLDLILDAIDGNGQAAGIARGVWYVSKQGDDADDGRSWQTAKLTLPAAITAATSQDAIEVGPGTFGDGAAYSLDKRVHIIGHDTYWDVSDSGAGGLILQTAASGGSLNGIWIKGGDNCVLSIGTPMNNIFQIRGCVLETSTGSWIELTMAAAIDVIDSMLVGGAMSKGIETSAASTTVGLANCVCMGTVTNTFVASNGSIFLRDVVNQVTSVTYDLQQSGDGQITVTGTGTNYDPAKVSGTIIDLAERAVTNVWDDVPPDSPTPGSRDEWLKSINAGPDYFAF